MGSQTFVARDYDVFAGLDVDKKSIAVTFSDHQGSVKSMRMPYSVDHLTNHVRKHYGDKKVVFAYEAGPTGYGVYDGLVAQQYPCLIASPSMIPKAPGQRVKTNRSTAVCFRRICAVDNCAAFMCLRPVIASCVIWCSCAIATSAR